MISQIKTKQIFLIFLFLIITAFKGYSQFFRYSTETSNVDISFLRPSLEAESNQSFFNVITVKNNGVRSEVLTLNLTVPDGWRVLGKEQQDLMVNPSDSVVIPIRVSVNGRVKGDIGYSVIASLTDTRGNTIKNEYCFVKIKRKEDLRVSIPIGVNYFDQRTNLSSFIVKATNNGNKEELVSFVLDFEKGIGFGDNFLENYSTDVVISPYSDTTFTYVVRLNAGFIEGKESFRLSFTARSMNKTFNQTVWFRLLRSNFENYIPTNDKFLTVDFLAQGLMSEGRRPNYMLIAQGKTLLINNNDIYYQYRNLSSQSAEDFYKYSQMHLGINYQGWNLEIGDSYKNQESSMQGRGVTLGYQRNRFYTNAIVNKNVRNQNENFGFFTGYYFPNTNRLDLGFIYNNNINREIESIIPSIGTRIKLGHHSFYALAAINPLKRDVNGETDHLEYSGEIRYSSNIKNLRSIVRLRYGTPLYYGHYRGRLFGYLNSTYTLSNTHRLSFYALNNDNKTPVFQGNNLLYYNTNDNFNARIIHSWDITPKVNLYYGPGYEEYSKNQATGNIVYEDDFHTRLYSLQAGSRFRFEDPYTSLSPRVTIGNVNVVEFPKLYGNNPAFYDEETSYLIYYLDVNYRSRFWSILTSYEAGPRNIYTQFNYFFSSRSTRTLRIMPSYSSFIYKNVMKLDASLSFSNDMILKNTYVNTSVLFTWFLPQDWSAKVNAYYSISNRTTSSGVESYQSLYLEAGIRKEFNLAHPRVSYHNLTLILFKDFNGNFTQEPNEPGIRDVLVNLIRERKETNDRIPGDIGNIELMSDYLGRVSFENIPNGVYKIQYNPIGKDAGTFSKAFEDLTVNLDKNSVIYVPFVEKNKVFGKIVLNRSRLSGLGRIDLSNVRITATDSQGRSYSTLSDKNGDFILFAPITDEYILSVNNIFYENFDLRQNNFIVQFNGYKQFEVNFVFDEKVRRINFAATDPELQAGVMQVRRTTISGSVKDANTLQPIRARVNLINTRTNAVVTSTNSSAISGDYTLNFIAGDNYLLEVVADDYWYLSENLVLQQITTFMNITRDVQLRPVAVGSKVELNISFDVNSAFLAPESVAELNRLLRQIRNNPTVKLEIQGHCDDLEALQRPAIALERANAVARYLIENGFSNLEIRSLGNTVPAATNDTEEGRMRNRRIEVVVLSR